MKSARSKPIELTKKDWEEIAATLDLKRMSLKRGDYQPCLEHGKKCTACDIAWIEEISQIMDTIGPDGDDAAKRGVAPCS